MEPKFSDPNWWPHRIEQPKTDSPTRLILGTLVPTVVVIVVAVLVFTQRRDSAPASVTSVLTFETCLAANGVNAATRPGSTRQQAAIDNCSAMLPPDTHLGSFTGGTAAEQFDACMQETPRGRGGGRFGRGRPSEAFINTLVICRTLTGGGAPEQAQPAPVQTSTAPPIA